MFVHMQCMLSTIHRRKYDLGNIGRNGGASEGVTVLNSAFDDSTVERYIYVCTHVFIFMHKLAGTCQEPSSPKEGTKKQFLH